MPDRCTVCRRKLTDAESIRLGVGPVCLGKSGWVKVKLEKQKRSVKVPVIKQSGDSEDQLKMPFLSKISRPQTRSEG